MFDRWLGTTIRFLTWLTAAAVLTACGGGGGGDGGFLGPDNSPVYNLSIQSFDAAGNPSTSLTRANPLTIVATLKQGNDALAGEAVSLSTSVGNVSPDNGSALTDANGQATFELTYSGVVGAGEVVASFSKGGNSAEASIAIQSEDIGAPYALEITTLDPAGVASRIFSELAPLTVEARLYDVTGDQPVPVEGERLLLSTTLGVVSPENGSKLTDATGTAVFTVAWDGTLGAGVISLNYTPADADPLQRTANIESRGTPDLYSLSLETLSPSGTPTQEFSTSEPLTVRVSLASTGASTAGQLVNLTSTIGDVVPGNGQSLTDESGVALFELAAGSDIGAGVISASFQSLSGQITASANVERVATEIDRALLIELVGADGGVRSTFNEDEPLTVRVSILDANGDLVLVDDEVIDLASTIGAIEPENGSKLTVGGVAEFVLAFDGVVGAGEVTARYEVAEGVLIESANVESFSVEQNYVLTMVKSGGNALGQITATEPVTIRVRLLDSVGGAPVAGEIIKLSTSIADIDPENGEGVTNSAGEVVFTLSYSGVDGAGVVTAEFTSADDVKFANSLNIESAEQEPPYRITFTSVTGIGGFSDQFNGITPLAVTVSLTDDAGRPLSGEQVRLDATIGQVEPANGIAVTNSQGRATFSLTASGETGAGAIIARYLGELGEVTATRNVQEVTTPSDYAITITDVGGGVITDTTPLVVTVQLTSAGGSVSGQVIRLSSEVGAISPANGAVLTNASGVATFSLSYNNVVGAGLVTASFDAPEGTISDSAGVQATAAGVDAALAIASFDGLGNTTNALSSTSPLTLRVTLVDGNGSVIEVDDEIINLSSDIGVVTPTSGSALTSAGVAQFTLSANGTLGAGIVTASYSVAGATVTQTYAVQVVSGDLFTLNVQSSGGNLSASNTLTITVTLQDDDGVPQSNEIITASASLGFLVATSAVTDAAGEARFTLEYNGEIGAGLFVASFDTPDGTLSNSINITSVDAPPPYLLEIETLEDINGNSTVQFSSESPLIVTVRLLEIDGVTPVANTVVGLSSTLGSISPSNGTSLTNASGRATFTLTAGGETGAGVIVAFYGVDDTLLTVQRNVEAVAANQNYSMTYTSISNGGVITPSDAVELQVTLVSTDTVLYPIGDQVITLESEIGVVNPSNGSARTDASGVASFTLSFDGVVGAGQATATFEASGGTVTALTSVESSAPGAEQLLKIMTTQAVGLNPNEFGPNSPLAVDVAIVDSLGNVLDVDGALIDLSTTIGQLSPPNGRALTTDGIASFSLVFDGNVGGGELTAEYNAGVANIQVRQAVQAVVDNNFQLSITQLTNGDLSINNPLTFEVELLNEDGSPAASEAVELSVVNGSLSQGTVLTDNNGLATVVVTYGGQAGAGSLTGQFSSLEGTFTNTLNFRSVDEAPDYAIAITELLAPDGVTATTSFSSSAPLTVVVTLEDENGASLQNRPVSLELSGIPGSILPDNGVVITDLSGEALFEVNYGGLTGGGELTATYAGPVGDVIDTIFVSAVVADLDVGSLDDSAVFQSGVIRALPTTSVSYLGSVELLLVLVDSNGDLITTTESVRFDSPCLLNGFSSLDSGLTSTVLEGLLSVTYNAGVNCEDRTDTVTATLLQPGLAAQQTATIDLAVGAAPAANQRFITFIDADPINIALQGTGGGANLEERSQVTFEVRDGAGNPVPGQTVTFALSTTTGGIELADNSATTDASGQVSATVYAGVIATPVRVYATTERDVDTGETITVVSDVLSITSGIATQARFTMNPDVLNPPNAANTNGVEVALTARAYDRFGNPVPDGTSVVFTSECGGVGQASGTATPSGSCETTTGVCTLIWSSQNGSQVDCPLNRVTVLAHVLGEEGFIDADSDGYFGIPGVAPSCPGGTYPPFGNAYLQEPAGSECFIDNPEAWRDDNEDGTFNAGTTEIFIDIDSGSTAPNGQWDDETPPSGALFNGLACQSDGTTCSTQLVSVFASTELVAGPSDASELRGELYQSDGTGPLDPASDNVTAGGYFLLLSDQFDNVPPLGTTLSAQGNGECEVVSPDVSVGNSSANTPFVFGITIRTEADDAATDDYIEITWAIPDGTGNEAQLIFNCVP